MLTINISNFYKIKAKNFVKRFVQIEDFTRFYFNASTRADLTKEFTLKFAFKDTKCKNKSGVYFSSAVKRILNKYLAISASAEVFNTDDYDSRINLWEYTSTYKTRLLVLYGKGYRYTLALKPKILKDLKTQLGYAATTKYWKEEYSAKGETHIYPYMRYPCAPITVKFLFSLINRFLYTPVPIRRRQFYFTAIKYIRSVEKNF